MKLASVFSDGAVLQRQAEIPVWGMATPGSLIQGKLAGQTTYCRTSADGAFRLIFLPLEAGGPYVLTVTDLQNEARCSVSDVYVGEVWLASGQSNMDYALNTRWFAGADGTEKDMTLTCVRQEAEFQMAMDEGDFDDFHFLALPHQATMAQEDSFPAVWRRMTTEASEASAVAAWFGLKLHSRLKVPVGLIIASWGTTTVESWTSRGALLSNPDTRKAMRDYVGQLGEQATWTESLEAREQLKFKKYAVADAGNEGLAKGWADLDFTAEEWSQLSVPGSWVLQKLAGNGAVWIRLDIQLTDAWTGQPLTLNLGGIDKQDVAYFNGVEIGRTGKEWESAFWNQPRHYAVPAELVRPGRNVIAVRAYSFAYDGAFNGKPNDYSLCTSDGRLTLPLGGIWRAKAERDLGKLEIPNVDQSCYGPDFPNTPSILFDSMIRPLLPYAIRGAIWYQGESNADSMTDAKSYGGKLMTMIRDWRQHWENPEFPFILVELANFRKPMALELKSLWAVLREQQHKTAKGERNVYLATAIDSGEAADIHPQDKRTVGWRLAEVALKEVYGQQVVATGPRLVAWSQEPGSHWVRLTFEQAMGMKLVAEAGQAFFLAGIDRRFFPADRFNIQGNLLRLVSTAVDRPVAVRYAWADNPASVLYNGAGLPASPFRTDDWEADTVSLD